MQYRKGGLADRPPDIGGPSLSRVFRWGNESKMKVVINRCWGGFGVSTEALKWLRERGYVPAQWPNEVLPGEKRGDSGEVNDRDFNTYRLDNANGKRDDTLLVECVETLGAKARGVYANLIVVEIPDGVNYEIDEYDGQESIHEVHRSWT
jgi:hypothetical protein